MRAGAAVVVLAVLAACAPRVPEATGRPALAPADEAELKSAALRGARQEIQRSGAGSDALRLGVYLDTLVGLTPEAFRHEVTHRPEWLRAVTTAGLVDDTFGPATVRRGLVRRALTIEVGAPWPVGRDTFAILYAWCVRRLPLYDPTPAAGVSVWRDAFVRTDSGWALTAHRRAVAPTACVR